MRSDLLFLQLTCKKGINIPQMYLPHLREETYLRLLKPFGYKVVTVSKRAGTGELPRMQRRDWASAVTCVPASAFTASFSTDDTRSSL